MMMVRQGLLFNEVIFFNLQVFSETNTPECEWDKGDCCQGAVGGDRCTKCECLGPTSSTSTVMSTTYESTSTTPDFCRNYTYASAGNGFCEDGKLLIDFLFDTSNKKDYK